MAERTKQTEQKKIRTLIKTFAFLFLAVFLIANNAKVNDCLYGVLLFLRPVLLGITLAYVSNPIFRFFERKVLFRLNHLALRRWLSILLTYLVLLLVVVLLLWSIIPQFAESVASFLERYDSYFASAVESLNRIIADLNESFRTLGKNAPLIPTLDEERLRESVSAMFGSESANLVDYLSNVSLGPFIAAIRNVFAWGADIFFAVLISTYLLATKEKRYAQIMKCRRAFFSRETNARITKFCTVADKSFGGFLEGKIVDSLIIGVLTYIAVSVFKMPYPIMIAVFVGITNIIPVVGPLIGAIPTGFIILLTDPSKVIPFLIIILVIQQLDGNVIGPKILGDNTGVSSLCVLIAITVMGTLWGFVGMLVGVPLFATVLEISESFIKSTLQKKGLPSALESYYSSDAVINPSKTSGEGSDKLVQCLERSNYRIQRKLQADPQAELSRNERMTLRFYRLGLKFRLITPPNEEQLVHYSADYAVGEAMREEKEFAKNGFGFETETTPTEGA